MAKFDVLCSFHSMQPKQIAVSLKVYPMLRYLITEKMFVKRLFSMLSEKELETLKAITVTQVTGEVYPHITGRSIRFDDDVWSIYKHEFYARKYGNSCVCILCMW